LFVMQAHRAFPVSKSYATKVGWNFSKIKVTFCAFF
jgi:hypothetical protein